MTVNEVAILIQLVIGALSTFFAILLWAKTRDIAWILIIMGTLVDYANIVVNTLSGFGILDLEFLSVFGLPLIGMLLANVPRLLYITGFIIVIRRNKLL
ncbi:MAG: hypothetical protein JW969_16975 [Spirochaetales bacterium]|nr:hypothetical protein [Spirochaetales bacterium]